ncbi:MAG: hypothetical protein ABW044_10100, partial [Cellvibrio sp.]
MGYILVVILLTVLLLILWLPTLITLLIRKSTFKQIMWFLFFEILIAIGLIATLDFIGATNPAGYMLVIAILVSIGG